MTGTGPATAPTPAPVPPQSGSGPEAESASHSAPPTVVRSGGKARQKGQPVAALDIGASKITCLIGRPEAAGAEAGETFALCGAGRQQTRGYEGGRITDLPGLERSIRLAVEEAERQAGFEVSHVRLGIAGPRVGCQLAAAAAAIDGRDITPRDITRIQAAALTRVRRDGLRLLSAHPLAYRVDDQEGVRDPVGMVADSLQLLINAVTAPASLVSNLTECLARAHLGVERVVPSPTASGLSTLSEDEMANGALCVDMGSDITAVSVFVHGAPAWLSLVPVGGRHVTRDIMQILGTTFSAAERLKTLNGRADRDVPGADDPLDAPRLGANGRLVPGSVTRGELAAIISPRIEETFELVRDTLAQSDAAPFLPRRAVLTGAASQLPGVADAATRILGAKVRAGRPIQAEALGETCSGPGFASAAGLLAASERALPDMLLEGAGAGPDAGGPVSRAIRWLYEHL